MVALAARVVGWRRCGNGNGGSGGGCDKGGGDCGSGVAAEAVGLVMAMAAVVVVRGGNILRFFMM